MPRAHPLCRLLFFGLMLALAARAGPITIERTTYRGWSDALRLSNPHIEVIVVPEIGRVMSFRFRDGENVFWEDPALAGQRGDSSGKQWVNFGGDKTWPAPEAEWKNYTKRSHWMPPPAFDALPASAALAGDVIVLTSPVDPFYGIRTIRQIRLKPDDPEMIIETAYERLSGEPSKIAIWVITQFTHPVAVFLPIPPASKFPNGHFVFRDTPWPQLSVRENLLHVIRDPAANHKLGSDADRMLWIGEAAMCLVSTPRRLGAEYPDRGASAEVYTNADPKKYVELETLGPLASMKPGDRISQTNTYRLFRRAQNSHPETEARRLLAPGTSR